MAKIFVQNCIRSKVMHKSYTIPVERIATHIELKSETHNKHLWSWVWMSRIDNKSIIRSKHLIKKFGSSTIETWFGGFLCKSVLHYYFFLLQFCGSCVYFLASAHHINYSSVIKIEWSILDLIVKSLSVTEAVSLCLMLTQYRFTRFRKNYENRLLASSFLSVHPHQITRLPLDGFSLKFTFHDFLKITLTNSKNIKISQE